MARKAEIAACALLLIAEKPVISVNGNTVALVGEEIVKLSNILNIPIEVNLFHRTEDRVRKIENLLRNMKCKWLISDADTEIPDLASDRRIVSRKGIYSADVVFVPLEDGDRCEKLIKMGKKVITVDLNPLSRTARYATITIVDNIVRAVPNMLRDVDELLSKEKDELLDIISSFNNEENLKQSLQLMHI